jgi:hypothetical protein
MQDLRQFGHGGIGGCEMQGVYGAGVPDCVVTTMRYREIGMPSAFVVVEHVDEFMYCLDTAHIEGDECPVVYWDLGGYTAPRYDTFLDFLLHEFRESIANL